MPQVITELKEFIVIARGQKPGYPKPISIRIKKTKNLTKFKLRLPKYLLTFVVKDEVKATKIYQSIPPNLPKDEIKGSK